MSATAAKQPYDSVKLYTNGGVAISRYTMRIVFAPRYARNGKTEWTYRPDIERKKFANRPQPIFFASDAECLRHIFLTVFNRAVEIQKFDNARPFRESCFEHWVMNPETGKLVKVPN